MHVGLRRKSEHTLLSTPMSTESSGSGLQPALRQRYTRISHQPQSTEALGYMPPTRTLRGIVPMDRRGVMESYMSSRAPFSILRRILSTRARRQEFITDP